MKNADFIDLHTKRRVELSTCDAKGVPAEEVVAIGGAEVESTGCGGGLNRL